MKDFDPDNPNPNDLPTTGGKPISRPIDSRERFDNDPRDSNFRWPGMPGYDWNHTYQVHEPRSQVPGSQQPPRVSAPQQHQPRRHEAAGAESDLRRLAHAAEDVAAAIENVAAAIEYVGKIFGREAALNRKVVKG